MQRKSNFMERYTKFHLIFDIAKKIFIYICSLFIYLFLSSLMFDNYQYLCRSFCSISYQSTKCNYFLLKHSVEILKSIIKWLHHLWNIFWRYIYIYPKYITKKLWKYIKLLIYSYHYKHPLGTALVNRNIKCWKRKEFHFLTFFCELKRRIRNPVKHLWCSIFTKTVNG